MFLADWVDIMKYLYISMYFDMLYNDAFMINSLVRYLKQIHYKFPKSYLLLDNITNHKKSMQNHLVLDSNCAIALSEIVVLFGIRIIK